MNRTIRRAAAALMLMPLAACGFMQRQSFGQPEVVVDDVRLTGIGLQGGKIDIILAVYNPNNYRLDASQLQYTALIDTLRVADGTIAPRVTLVPKDTSKITVPMNFGFRQVAAAAQMAAQRGTIPFRVYGDLKIDTPFGSVTRKFDQRGTYDGVNVSIDPRRK
jgi:LEA14-like dessication related protein